MHIRQIIILWVILFLFFSKESISQEIDLELNRIDSLNTAYPENTVKDINNEICSMIIIKTDRTGIKFYSNLGVEKIVQEVGGYRLWLPYRASLLKISVPGCSLFEYHLPGSNSKYSVYAISLNIIGSGRIILKDTIQPYLSFVTNPPARIYLNGIFLGRTPKRIDDPNLLNFNYTLKKKGYASYSGNDSMDLEQKKINITLQDLSRKKRLVVLINTKLDGSKYNIDANYGMKGGTIGLIGKTGFYGSFNMLKVELQPGLEPPNNADDFYTYNKGKKICFAGGVTQQLLRSLFIYGGPAYTSRIYQRQGSLDATSKSFNLNTGVLFRIGWDFLLQIDYCPGINKNYSSLGIGIGGNFKI